ncbi:PVC-type heme-binding CxxCH protein [Catenovulum adriaticum]|uniref:Discoidin domain-containing protein n=1 Tax=Catenovulum adriaticum TaxID=2984846 RepID=A0ABY7AQQ2_9ALTE|nr:PVC-type heme-binding CxxCH protein [Catenovulum sp. TS8]WAJ71878.1 discoidin domain-containing protein [Catenovulum sp. TS8]
MFKTCIKTAVYLAVALQLGCLNHKSTHTVDIVDEATSSNDSSSVSSKTGHTAAYHQNDHQPTNITGLSPQESLATMVVQDGFKMELVAHEPMVEEPVTISFDGNGRMYVAEMLTYMQDLDGTGQMEASSRIKRLEDTDNDGVMDKSTVFAENLLLPRMILPLEDGKVVVRETNTFDFLLLEDTDGDGVADKRSTIYEGGPRGGNLEHQPSGLIWGLDNWLYVTYTNKRYKIKNGKIISQNTRFGGGQWGIGQDEAGRLYYSAAGAEEPVFGFNYPSVYGMVPVDGETEAGFNEVFPIEQIPDVQSGKPRLRDDNTLNHFTGIAGQSIYLGDKFPEIYGNYIAPEPVGNLVRRADITRDDGYSVISHPYQAQQKEFIASTDTAFRPVWSETGPDGTIYLVDMYRGIIQEGNWTKKGSFLRAVIEKFNLDKIIGGGRIYRITKPGIDLGKQPKMYDETAAELVKYLSHPNQWWRINAQKYIVLSEDKSVAPALKAMAQSNKNPLARLHALWTLEGLGILDKELLITKFADTNVNVRTAALRISEQLVTKENQSMVKLWKTQIKNADIEMAQQILLSTFYVDTSDENRNAIRDLVLAKYPHKKGLLAIDKALQYQIKEKQAQAELAKNNKVLAESIIRGKQHFDSLCSTCHGKDGQGAQAGDKLMAPSFANSRHVNGDVSVLGRIVLNGLTGPIDGKTYLAGIMAPIADSDDLYIADVLTYIRNSFGNKATMVTPEQIASIRKIEHRSTPWTSDELDELYNQKLTNKKLWKFSASHNSTKFDALIDGKADWNKWDSEHLQEIGMWLQVELPQIYQISRVDMDCRKWNWRCATAFDLAFSVDGVNWQVVDSNIENSAQRVSQTLGHKAKYIRYVLKNGSPKQTWSVTEIDIFGSPVK